MNPYGSRQEFVFDNVSISKNVSLGLLSFHLSCSVSEHTCCFIASQSARSVSDSEEGVSGMLKKGTWLPVGQEVEEPVDEIVGADSRRRSAFLRTKYCSKFYSYHVFYSF